MVQRRVITLAKKAPERAWLAEAPSGSVHDRDVNAAINILAAGRAERRNACGGDVRPGETPAVASETGTHRSVA